jgi:hypothetical protein
MEAAMESETRRRALRAVAKVAFGAAFAGTLPGCGGRAQTDFNGPRGDGGSGAASPDTSSGSALVDAGPTHVATGGGPSSAIVDAGPTHVASAGGAGGASGVGGAAGGALRCLGPVDLEAWPASSTPISVAEFACCRDYDNGLTASLADAGLIGAAGATDELSADPSFANCCKALIAGGDQRVPINEDAWSYPALSVCCHSPNMSEQDQLWGHLYCTPWGPPVPPALDPLLQDVA